MKRRMPVVALLAVAVICLSPLSTYASLVGWSQTYVGTQEVGGRTTTMDGTLYLAAIMLANVDGVIAAQDYKQLQPAPGGFLIAMSNTNRASFSSGQHLLEVHGFHESGDLADGTGKEVSTSYDSTYFVNGSRSASVDVNQLSLTVAAKLHSAHSLVEAAYGIDQNEYHYFTYRDHQVLGGNVSGIFPDQDAAETFIEAAMHVHLEHLTVGDMGPGYWIVDGGTEAIIGTQKADGSLVAFLVKLDGFGWELQTLTE